MATDESTLITGHRRGGAVRAAPPVPALAIVWSRSEPRRLGEIALLPPDERDPDYSVIVGRGNFGLMRQRPGLQLDTGPLEARGISRQQWRIHPRRGALGIENLGRRELLVNGVRASRTVARQGDLLEIDGELLLVVVARPREMAAQRLPLPLLPPFGDADDFGLVGESVVAWELRRQVAFAAGREDHVLITGASGSGKELAASAIHALSPRGGRPLVSRSAATLPDGLVDAELFGNIRDYPSSGMAERPGLVGAADGSTLFLDEIGEVSHALQAHLLRVLDSGEYHRLGEARARRADIRMVAATNRDPMALKHDLLARLRLRVRLPGLDKRREDIPLIARHLLRGLARRDPEVGERAFIDGDVDGEPSWTAAFVGALVKASYQTNVRELQGLLWDGIGRAGADGLNVEAPSSSRLDYLESDTDSLDGDVDPTEVTGEQVLKALAEAGGNRERAWRALGLRSRHQLLRIMRRLGIDARRAAR